MIEIYDCIVCTLAYGPEEKNGVRQLKTFKGYTVDLRIRQFRKVPFHALPQFIDFDSPEGQELVAEMHEKAIKVANKMINKMRHEQKK